MRVSKRLYCLTFSCGISLGLSINLLRIIMIYLCAVQQDKEWMVCSQRNWTQ